MMTDSKQDSAAPPSPRSDDGPWIFDRYVNGKLMAEGGEIINASSMEHAAAQVVRIFADAPGSVFVLRSRVSPRSDEGSGLTPSKHGFSAALRAQVIEECADVADNYARDGRVYKEYACETADEIAARIRSLSAVSAIAQERDVGEWKLIDDGARIDNEVLLANVAIAGGNQVVAWWDAERDDDKRWDADGSFYHKDAFTHYKLLGPGPGDRPTTSPKAIDDGER